jgi:type IV secretion system protein VirD4
MYELSRFLLMVSVLAMAWCAGVAVWANWESIGWLAVLFAFVCVVLLRRGGRQLTTLGSARWAQEPELRRAGMIGGPGLILGRLPGRATVLEGIGAMFRRGPAVEACRRFLAGLKRGPRQTVTLSRAIHTAVFSPSGGGKGVSCVVPFLLRCPDSCVPDSCVVVDFKGENAKLTAEHRRRRFGHRIVMLDPFHVVTDKPDRFNPLAYIRKDSPQAIDECNDLAKALVIRTGEEKEPHWNDSAEAWIAAVLALVVRYGEEPGKRSLQTMREILSHPEKLDMAVKAMCESDAWGGMLGRFGGQLMQFVDKEKSSTLTTVARHLRFLDTPAIAESTIGNTFDPAELLAGRMTVYLILPPEHMRAQSPLLRMWIGSLLRAVIRGGLQEKNKVHVILDEAASLGHLEAVDDAVDKYRGYGVRLQLYFQSLGQLRRCFPEGQEQTLLSNTSQVFFGVNDNATADYVSARLGEATIIVDSGGTSVGKSDQKTSGMQLSTTAGWNTGRNSNWQQQARKLLKPEEIMALPARTAITFTPGVRPVCTTLLRHYEEPGLREGWLRRQAGALRVLAAALLISALTVGAAAALTHALLAEASGR